MKGIKARGKKHWHKGASQGCGQFCSYQPADRRLREKASVVPSGNLTLTAYYLIHGSWCWISACSRARKLLGACWACKGLVFKRNSCVCPCSVVLVSLSATEGSQEVIWPHRGLQAPQSQSWPERVKVPAGPQGLSKTVSGISGSS